MRGRPHFLICLLLITVVWKTSAQQGRLDARLRKMPDDSVKVLYIHKLVDSLRERSSKQALFFALEGKLISERIGYQKGLAKMLESIGWMHYRNSDLSEALKVTFEALEIARKTNSMPTVASCLISVAAIQFEQKDYSLAISNFKEAARLSYLMKDMKTYGRSMNNIGFCFIQKHEFDSASRYSKVSYDVAKHANEPYVMGFACRNLGEIAVGQDNFTRAIIHYNEGLDLAESSSNNYLKISILYRLGAAYNHLQVPHKAIPILSEAIAIGREHGYREELERALRLIAESYLQVEDYATAFVFQSSYIALHDSLTNEKRIEQMSLAQAKFDSELKQAEIEVLTRDAALQQEAFRQQRLFTYFSIGCATVFLVFMFVLWYQNRRIKGSKRIVDHRNKEIKQQAALLRETNATKDKLFSIISHDLRSPLGGLKGLMELISRDGVTQAEFVKISQNLRRNIDSVYDDLDNLLQWSQTQLNGIKSSKELFNLRDLVIDKMHLFEEVARAKGVALMNEVEEGVMVYADKNQIGLVIRNLIANAVKFSSINGRVEVCATRQRGSIEITVLDAGVGMSESELNRLFKAETHFSKRGTQNEKGIGLGLILAKEFVESNDGSITVKSELGKGSTFIVSLSNQSLALARQEAMIA